MSKNKDKKANVKGLRSLLYNNKFVLLLSVILAFGIWIWESIEKSPEVEVTISSVPVKIDMDNSVPAQLNLQIFGDNNYTVDVTVKGKKFIVSALTADDFSVVAQTNYVDSAGKKSLQLKATSAKSDNFDIVGLSKNYIEVYFDTYKETEKADSCDRGDGACRLLADPCTRLHEPASRKRDEDIRRDPKCRQGGCDLRGFLPDKRGCALSYGEHHGT